MSFKLATSMFRVIVSGVGVVCVSINREESDKANKSVMNIALGVCEEINLNGVEHEIERTLSCFINDARPLIFFIAATLFSIVQLGF
jgi:hypothetical protein